MQIDVTNAFGNWANVAQHSGALLDGQWLLNSNLMVWLRAESSWSNNLAPQLMMSSGTTNLRIYASENGGHVTCDGKWHPYTYAYTPALFASAAALSLTWEVTCDGTPKDQTFYIDNIRLRPGIVPEPMAALSALGLAGAAVVCGRARQRVRR